MLECKQAARKLGMLLTFYVESQYKWASGVVDVQAQPRRLGVVGACMAFECVATVALSKRIRRWSKTE